MGYFKENTVTIEAEKWDAFNIEPNGLIDIGLHSGSLRRNADGTLLVRTSWGDYNANPGDWIVKDKTGKLRIPRRSKEIFEKEYSPVDQEDLMPENTDGSNVYEEEKASIRKARVLVERQCPNCRVKSLVLTKLEEASLWMEQIPIEVKD